MQSTAKKGTGNSWIAGVIAAIVASLCCITPVFALIGGLSGMASAFTWLEPFRPYLIGFTILVFAYAWYKMLKPKSKEEIECACEADDIRPGTSAESGKPKFIQSKTFLFIITFFAALMLAFPYYSHIFYPETESKVVIIESGNVVQANFDVEGMTCTGCEEHIKNAVAQLPGFIEATADHQTGKVTVKYDKSKSSLDDVVAEINKTGYKTVRQEEVKIVNYE